MVRAGSQEPFIFAFISLYAVRKLRPSAFAEGIFAYFVTGEHINVPVRMGVRVGDNVSSEVGVNQA